MVETGSTRTFKRYIGGIAVQTLSQGSSTVRSEILLHDHLGSVVSVYDNSNATLPAGNQMDYGPFGTRRLVSNPEQYGPGVVVTATDKGFTGHAMLDQLGVIHMGGRIYDPLQMRFMQADPFVQDPLSAQSYNRYLYLWNNPLNGTDPTGYLGITERQWLGSVVAVLGAVFAPEFSGTWAKLYAMGYYAAVGAVSGGITTGSWNGAVKGAFSGAITAGFSSPGSGFMDALNNGFVGGAVSSMTGGKFGHGFVSAGLGTLAGPAINSQVKGPTGQIIAHALVGGSISAVTGGKFANGAATGAFRAALAVGSAARSDLDRQQGANADKNDRDVEVLTKRVRTSFSAARTTAMSALEGYCSAQGGCAAGSTAQDFEAVEFRFDRKLFFGDETHASVGLTGGYPVRSTSPPSVVLYAGGIAFQGNGTGPKAVAEVLLQLFRHVSPPGNDLSQQYWESGQSLPYLQRPHEIDAFNYAKEVMKYAK